MLRRGHHVSIAADDIGVETNQFRWRVIWHDSAPELGMEPGDEVHAAHGRPGFAKRSDRAHQLRRLLAFQRVELEVSVGRSAEGEDAALRGGHPLIMKVTVVTEHEAKQIERANASRRTPVVFIHGLWLLPSSWDRWAALFEGAGCTALTPGWPDDPETVADAKANPDVFAHKTVGQVADYIAGFIGRLDKKPAVIGHSFGGLMTQIIAGRGLAAASVAIDPAPFRGVLPLPVSALRSAQPSPQQPV